MIFRRRSRPIAGVALTTAISALTPAFAQVPPGTPIDEIIVTGTRIPRLEETAPTPVAAFDRPDITAFGVQTADDFLNTLPQVAPDFGKAANNPGDGSSSVNLRGLGSGRTLVLLNGRRLAPTGVGTSIDVNAIPPAMLERVEVVTGGASAVYGSDAVTGAVNFITRNSFKGIELSGQYDVYGAGDGDVYNFSIGAGTPFSDGRGQVSVFADFLDRGAILAGARDFTAVTLNQDYSTGTYFPGGSSNTPNGGIAFPGVDLGTGPGPIVFEPGGTAHRFGPADRYNFAPDNYLQTPLRRWTAGLLADFDVSDKVTLYSELIYAKPTSGQQLAPAPGTFFGSFTIDPLFFDPSIIPALSAATDPDMDGVGDGVIARRFEEVGPRIRESDRTNYRAVAGFRADIGDGWNLDAYYSYARNETVERLINAVSLPRLQQGLLIDPMTGQCLDPSNGCVPVNIFGPGRMTPEAAEFIRFGGLQNEDVAVQHVVSAAVQGELFDWSEGSVQSAFGAEFRRNSAEYIGEPGLETGDALGFQPLDSISGAINVYEIFGEIVAPVLADRSFAERIEIEAGGRYSHYSTAGSVWTWKAGGQWMIPGGFRMRGMWQRAVRAPNVQELFSPSVSQAVAFNGDDDFCSASKDPVGRGLDDVCIAQGMDPAQIGIYEAPVSIAANFFQSGNPALGPERAGTITAGVEYYADAPISLRISADYFSIKIRDSIAILGRADIACSIVGDPQNPTCQTITRLPSGLISTLIEQPINVAVDTAKGIDFALDASIEAPAMFGEGATLTLQSGATLYLEKGYQESAASPFIDCVGGYHIGCSRNSASVTNPGTVIVNSLTLGADRWDANLRWRRISSLENLQPVFAALAGNPPPVLAEPETGSKNYLDFAVRWNVFGPATLRAGVENILATKPPLLGSEQAQSNTDPSRYTVFGRRIFVGFTVRFGEE